ncbi:MAG: CDP-diacylglycerol--glycerol-3-phosphate 3-phosphatidyltransferase [Micavibrio sp.]|nr:CDP-diacylglycerol--glycerol-3-phosphate 3-phosphatidyltransferase [Micavibrio sp.]
MKLPKLNYPKGLFSIPNLLCFYRAAYLPVMIALSYADSAWRTDGISWPAWTNLFLFALAGLSDFLDGIIARALGQTTLLGKFLDSSTDKLVVGVALMCLVAFHQLEGIWLVFAIVIYMREILIAGVREFMGLYNVVVHISKMGKWKLTVQMFSIGFLIVGDYGDALVPHTMAVGKFFFLIATLLTVWSGWEYMREAWKTIQKMDAAEAKI